MWTYLYIIYVNYKKLPIKNQKHFSKIYFKNREFEFSAWSEAGYSLKAVLLLQYPGRLPKNGWSYTRGGGILTMVKVWMRLSEILLIVRIIKIFRT